jgi:hypothetical protein
LESHAAQVGSRAAVSWSAFIGRRSAASLSAPAPPAA